VPDNTITVIGNLTREPELRFTNSGRAQARMGIAVNRRYQQNGEWVEQTSFFNVVAWAELAENAAGSLHKGNRVIVTGRLEQRNYENQLGEKRDVVEIVADEIAPSLRWATAEVTRTERREGGGGGGGYSGGGGGGGYSGGGGGGNRPAGDDFGAPSGGGGGYGNDEEPF
jgi:single-strand DNA-binding protein